MPDRQPEPCESSAAGPFLTMETGHSAVEVWALGMAAVTLVAPSESAAAANA
jgi:hypothetical protein